MELSRQRISLKKLMNESAEVTATEARKKKQDFRVEIDLIHEYVQGDPVRLRQVFIDLCLQRCEIYAGGRPDPHAPDGISE